MDIYIFDTYFISFTFTGVPQAVIRGLLAVGLALVLVLVGRTFWRLIHRS